MRTIAPLSSLALLVVCALPAAAAEWHAGSAVPIPALASDPIASARVHVMGRGDLALGGVELDAGRVVAGKSGARVVRFAQTFDGVPVLGSGVIVRVSASGVVSRVAVEVARDLELDTVPTLDADLAQAALADTLGRTLPAASKSRLVVLRLGGARLAYELDVRDSLAGTRYFVDAHDGSLLAKRDLATHAQGRVYSMNSVETPVPVDVALPLLDETAVPVRLNGWSGNFAVTNYVSGDTNPNTGVAEYVVEQTVEPNVGADFLYDPPADVLDPGDAFAQVNLYFHMTSMRAFFEPLGADFTVPSAKLTAVANVQQNGGPLDNAFFSPAGIEGPFAAGNLIAIGQGSVNDFAYDSDVFKHEFGHFVSDLEVGYNMGQAFSDDLGLSPWSGSMDEGIADYFACSANDDAELGEGSLGGQIRDLADTSKTCPNDMQGEVHGDGELIGSFGWSLRLELGAPIADQLVWGAVLSMPQGGDFSDFAQGILATADELVTAGDLTAADVTTIEGLMAERGLDNCGRVIALGEGETTQSTIIGLDLLGQLFGQSCSAVQSFGVAFPTLFHYSFTPAASDKAIKFDVNMNPQGGGDVQYTIYARVNDTVSFDLGFGGLLPEIKDFDYSAAITEQAGSLVIDANSDPPFDPSATYDFVVVSTSCPTLEAEFSVASYEPPVNEGGSGPGTGGEAPSGGETAAGGSGGGGAADDDDDDGCGCKTAGDREPTSRAWLALGGLALLGLRRRKR